ncbi:hypothetical protein EV126DRAFT_106300 [Verticillium dahliae]|nr:hypothetical protein EV126DRAFT_106300 [Verticillium dahliae]
MQCPLPLLPLLLSSFHLQQASNVVYHSIPSLVPRSKPEMGGDDIHLCYQAFPPSSFGPPHRVATFTNQNTHSKMDRPTVGVGCGVAICVVPVSKGKEESRLPVAARCTPP